MELSLRLKLIYDMLGGGDLLIDVGTDHAYLPIALVADGKYSRAVASDIAEGPLATARENIAAAGLAEKISAVLSDGFCSVELPGGDFCVSVCGMGGEMIASVLGSSEEISHAARLLVLQPMTKDWRLRKYLWDHGYAIIRERAVCESGKLYIAFAARYTGTIVNYAEEELHIGKSGTQEPSRSMVRWLEKFSKRQIEIARSSGDERFLKLAYAAETELYRLRRKQE